MESSMIGTYMFGGSKDPQKSHCRKINLLTSLVSALKWKSNNGHTVLHINSEEVVALKEIGLADWLSVFDVVDVDVIDQANKNTNINSDIFWNLSKMACHKHYLDNDKFKQHVFLDLDLIYWDKFIPQETDLIVSHVDYIDIPDVFRNKPREIPQYVVGSRGFYNYNMSFTVFQDRELLENFIYWSYKYMECLELEEEEKYADVGIHACISEQVILAGLTEHLGKTCSFELRDGPKELVPSSRSITHIWGEKAKIRTDSTLRFKRVKAFLRRIDYDMPKFLPLAKKIILNEDIGW